jgi:hypothetical protein
MVESFTIVHDDNGVLGDKSLNLRDFNDDSEVFRLKTNGYIYIGFRKPFSFFYSEMKVANTIENTMSYEFYNSTSLSWESMEVIDETRGFTASGFVTFSPPSNWGEVDIGSKTKYYIRLKPSKNHDASTEYQGINLVFSNDRDLTEERGELVNEDNNGSSYILKHQASKREIVQEIRGWTHKKDDDGNILSDITEFDLKLNQVRLASKYLTLSKIYLNELSRSVDDVYYQTGLNFKKEYKESLNRDFIAIDVNDNGIIEEEEKRQVLSLNARIG